MYLPVSQSDDLTVSSYHYSLRPHHHARRRHHHQANTLRHYRRAVPPKLWSRGQTLWKRLVVVAVTGLNSCPCSVQCSSLLLQNHTSTSHRAPLHSTSGRVQSVTVVFFLVENSSDDFTSSLEQCFVCAPSFTPEFPYSQLVSYSVSQCRPHSNLSLFSSLTSEAAQQQRRSTKPPAALQLQYFCTAMPLLPFR